MADKPLLQPEEVASVLSGGEGEIPGLDDRERGPVAYSLREPVAIPPDDVPLARENADALVATLQKTLRKQLGDDELVLAVEGFRQQRATTALSGVPGPVWAAAMLRAEGGGLLLLMNPVLALAVVERMLGGPGTPPEEGRPPTPLERRVIIRLGETAARALTKAHPAARFDRHGFELGNIPAAFADPGETVAAVLLRVRLANREQTALLLISVGLVQTASEDVEPVDLRIGPLAARLDEVEVPVRPVLRAGSVRLGDVSELEAGTVLRFEAEETSTPIDLRVAGRTVFTGRIARGEGGHGFHVGWRRGRRPQAETEQEDE